MDTFYAVQIKAYFLEGESPYSVQMRENADQKNFEYGHFLWGVSVLNSFLTTGISKPFQTLIKTAR